MLDVSQAVKNAYANPSSGKTLVIYFPELDYTVDPETVHSESFSLTESIMDTSSIEFVGCNPSKLQVQIQDFGIDVKGRRVQASVYTGETQSEPVPLFDGIIDTVTQQSNKRIKELVAYDELYSKGNTDIAQWYIAKFSTDWQDGVTLKDFRDALFEYLGITVKAATLVNDNLFFYKQFSPVNMKALDIIRYICQINGVFGIMNRYNEFEFRSLAPISPSTGVEVAYYKEIDYQEFYVKPVDKLIIRQSDLEEGVSVGNGINKYIVQGNFFTFNLEEEDLTVIATNLYPLISGIAYIPFKVTQVAYPWLECGDVVTYQVYDFEASASQGEDIYKSMSFYIFERYIKGIQAFRDEYEAQGEEYQTVFITNINAQIETIKNQIEAIQGQMNNIELKYLMFYNEQAVDVGDGQTKPISNIRFGVSNSGQVYIELEYLIECETTEEVIDGYLTDNDLVVTILYEYDGTIIDSRQPKETYQDGKHILHAYYVVDVDNTTLHDWKVWLNCVGGSVHIDIYQAQNTILGLGLIGQTAWDGTITVADELAPIIIPTIPIKSMIDNAIVRLITPMEVDVSDVASPVAIPTIGVSNITDDAEVDEVVTNAYVDESNVAEMTFDANYVEIRNHSFVEKIEWTSLGASEPIDSGYCTKVTPFVTDVTVDDVEII
jgi:hypothetical protein